MAHETENGEGWPDAKRKGWPLLPDKTLRHALQIGGGVAVRWWNHKLRIWTNEQDWPRGWTPSEIAVFDYIGPVLPAEQLREMLSAERGRCESELEAIAGPDPCTQEEMTIAHCRLAIRCMEANL